MTQRWVGVGERLLTVAAFILPLEILLGVFCLSAGTDETWTLFGVRGLAEHGAYGAGSPLSAVPTAGGLYTALTSLLHIAGGGRLEVIRLASVGSLLVLAFGLFRWVRSELGPGPAPWLAVLSLVAVPGTVVVGSQAYGGAPAVVTAVFGLWVSTRLEPGSWTRGLLVGALLGLAAATRWNVAPVVGAPFAAAVLTRASRKEIADGAIAFIVGVATFVGLVYALLLISVEVPDASHLRGASGTDAGPLPLAYLIPFRLKFFLVAESYVQVGLLASVVAGWALVRGRFREPRFLDGLVAFGALLWAAWLLKAPIAHLRYLWPALAVFAFVGFTTLALVYQDARASEGLRVQAAILFVVFAFVGAGALRSGRVLLHSGSDVISWEWNRRVPIRHDFGPFRYKIAEGQVVARLRALPEDDEIGVLGSLAPLAFLSRRTMRPVKPPDTAEGTRTAVALEAPRPPRWIVVTPGINDYPGLFITPGVASWLSQACRLDSDFGPYRLYEVTGEFPEDPDFFQTVGAWDLVPN